MNAASYKQQKIDEALTFANSMLGIPYRWCTDKDVNLIASCEDKFWAAEIHGVDARYIKEHDLSIVCTGLINLIRRHMGLSIPGRGLKPQSKTKFPGTTKKWFSYLEKQGRLIPFDPSKSYPVGTLLLAPFKSTKQDQGHVAIVIKENGPTVLDALILHAAPEVIYSQSSHLKDHGKTLIESIKVAHHGWFPEKNDGKGGGYFTHICLPEEWILKD